MLNKVSFRIRIVKLTLELLEKLFFASKLIKVLRPLSQNPQINCDNFVLVDVGANKAQNWKLTSKLFKVSSSILIEPNEKLHQTIKRTLKNKTYTIINTCVTNYNGFTEFYYSNFDLTSSIIKPNSNSEYVKLKKRILGNGYETIVSKKPCSTLDTLMSDLKIYFVNYLKIDVEGAELQVLEGAIRMIRSSKIGIIQLEIHENDMRNSSRDEILDLLQNHKYFLYKTVRHSFGNFSELIFISEDNKNLLFRHEITN